MTTDNKTLAVDVLARTTEDSSTVDRTSPRLDVLKRSLSRKTKLMQARIADHFDSVKSANGQPLNDKRNGRKTLDRWERQSDAIRNLSEGIEKTKAAIEREQAAIDRVGAVAADLPDAIKREIDSGLLQQWRKHPRTFFITGVNKARIVLLDDGRLAHRYTNHVTDPEQRRILARTFNSLSAELARVKGESV
ncbi:hypothetical protein [Stenotrophomonas geniculata]|uniref:hypothetical protein n=1 Tax=Stenotrophomonas geniculata TaxID=86188 RepID=UPI003D950BDA